MNQFFEIVPGKSSSLFFKTIAILLSFFVWTNLTSQNIALWNFQDIVSATNVDPNIIASNVTISDGSISFQNGSDDGGTRIGNSGSWNQGEFSTTEKYLQFSVTPNTGFGIDYESITLRFGRTGAGPQKVTVHYSLDNFATAGVLLIDNADVTSENANSLDSYSIPSSALPGGVVEETLTIRVWGHNASGTGNFRFNNFRVNGESVSTASGPLLITSEMDVSDLSYAEGSGPSAPQSFDLSGTNLDGTDVTIEAPTDFEISFEEMAGFDTELTLESFDGEDTTVYVRLEEGLAVGNYSGTLIVYGGGSDTLNVSLSGAVIEQFSIPYANEFRTEEDFETAELQGFVLTDVVLETGAGGYARITNSGTIESPQIDFTGFDGLEVFVDLRTFGGIGGQVLSLQASSDDGDNYTTIDSWSVPGSYETFSTVVDLRTTFNDTDGRLRFLITEGTNQVRFRDLEIEEHVFPGPPDPVFSIDPDTYFEDQTVFISNINDYDSGVNIYYTQDGDDPTTSDSLYDDAQGILLEDGSGTITLKAIAIDGAEESNVTTGEYVFPLNVSDIEALRNQSTGSTIYRVDNESTFLGGTSFRNTKFFQDDSGFGIQIDDPGTAVISTSYNIGDNVSELIGTLGEFEGQLQLTPLVDPEGPVSTDNEITPLIRQLDEITSDDQARLIVVNQIDFEDGDGSNEFGSGGWETNITDPSVTGFLAMFRNVFGDSDITNSIIPDFTVNITGIVQENNSGLKLAPRNLDDIEPFTSPLTVQPTSVNDVTCHGGSDGSIEIEVEGGIQPYSFSWEGPDGFTSSDSNLMNLEAGTYNLTVTDAEDSTSTSTAVINQPDDFTATFGHRDFSNNIQEISEGDTLCGFGEALWVNLIDTDGDVPLEVAYIIDSGQDTFNLTFDNIGEDANNSISLPFLPTVIEITFLSITDDNGCASQALSGFTFYISTLNAEATIFSGPDSVSVENGDQFDLYFSLDISGCDAVVAIFLEMEFDSDFLEVIDIEPIDWNTGTSQTTADSINNTDGFFSFDAEQFQSPNPTDTTFEFVKVTFEAKQTTGDSVTMLEYIPQGFVGGTQVWGYGFISLSPLVDIPIHIFGCDEFDIDMNSDPSCFGASDGLAEVNSVSGGTAPYSYLWSTGDTTQTIDSLAAGLYTVTVTDDEGCTGTAEVTVTERDSIQISTTVVEAECFGEDGSITMGATGGNGGFFNFTVNDENVGGSSGNLTINRPAGEYEIIATASNNGCQGSTDVIVNQPDSIQFNEQITDPLCPQETGTIEFDPSGGTGNISVTIADTAVSSPLALPDGTYTLVATDDEGCVDSLEFAISEPEPFSFFTGLFAPDCPGELWDFIFFAKGGTGQLTFTLNGDTIDAPLESGDFVGDSLKLPAGEYILLATDENECTFLVNDFSMVDAPPLPFPVEVFDAHCFGDDGFIVSNPQQGNFTYYVDGDSIGNALEFFAPAGDYLVTVEDPDGCTRDSVMTIEQPDSLQLNATVTNPECEGEIGQISFDPQGGMGDITVFLGDTAVSSPLDLPAGTYVFEVFDQNECVLYDTVTIEVAVPVSVSGQAFDAICHGNDGLLTFDAQGSSGNVTFLLNGDTVTSPLEVPAGTYTIVGISSDGSCSDSVTLEVNQPDAIVLSAEVTDANCFGEDGSISISATGGTGSFIFEVGDEFVGSGSVTVNRPAGEYLVSVTDGQECIEDTLVTIGQPDSLVLSAEVTDAPCFGEDGILELSAIGGTAPYYFFIGESPVDSSVMLPAGNYSIQFEDENGCFDSGEVDIGEPDPVEATFAVNGEIIEDGDTLSFTSIDSVLFSLDSILSGFAPLEVEYSIFDGTSTNDFTASSLEEGDEIFKQTFDAGFYDIIVTSVIDDNDCPGQHTPYLTFALDVEDAIIPLSGNVTIFSACADREVEVLFYDAGTTDLVSTQSGVLDSAGNFVIAGVITGQYDVFVDVGGYLLKGIAEVTVDQNNPPALNFGSLTAGDVTGNNAVEQADVDALLQAYNTQVGDAEYKANADFDCNGKVNIDDLTKLIENKGETGDQPGDL